MKSFIEYIEEAVIVPKDSKSVKGIITKGFREWYQDFLNRREFNWTVKIDYTEEFYNLTKRWLDGGLKSKAIWVLPAGTSKEAMKLTPISIKNGIIGAMYHPYFNNIKIYVNDKLMMKWLLGDDKDITKRWVSTLKVLMKAIDHELVHKEQWNRVPDNVRGAALANIAFNKAKWSEQFGEDYFTQPNEMMAYAQDAAKEIISYAQRHKLDPFEVQKKIQVFIKKHGNLFDSKEFSTYAIYLIYGIGARGKKMLNKFHKMVFQYLEQLTG